MRRAYTLHTQCTSTSTSASTSHALTLTLTLTFHPHPHPNPNSADRIALISTTFFLVNSFKQRLVPALFPHVVAKEEEEREGGVRS